MLGRRRWENPKKEIIVNIISYTLGSRGCGRPPPVNSLTHLPQTLWPEARHRVPRVCGGDECKRVDPTVVTVGKEECRGSDVVVDSQRVSSRG